MTALAGDTPRTRQALLACDEWIANVVSYSGAPRFEYGCEVCGDVMTLTFRDDGKPFDPTKIPDTSIDFDALDQGGMGLGIIRQSVSELRYARQDDFNELTMVFALDATPEDRGEVAK